MLARGTHSERGVMHLGHLPLREVARAGPCLGLVAHDGAHEPEQRTLRREDLHHARAALYLPVGALLHVVGVQVLPVRRREVKVRERVGLRLLEHPCSPRAATLTHLARRVVHGHGRGGVPGAEDRRNDAAYAAPQLSGAGGVHLDRRRDEGAVDALVAIKDILGEEAVRPERGDSQVECVHACLETAAPVAVPAVGPIVSMLVGLLVHDDVHDLFGEQSEQRLDVDHPVGRPRDGDLLRHRVCEYLHSGPRLFLEPVFVVIPDSRTGAVFFFRRLAVGAFTPTFPTRSRWAMLRFDRLVF